MGMADIAAQMNAEYAYGVSVATWGHLAPEKGVKYPIEFTVCVGFFSDDVLNPTLLACSEDGPWYGPWFYDAVREFVSHRIGKDENSGKVFRFRGHWRNYKFVGKFSGCKVS